MSILDMALDFGTGRRSSGQVRRTCPEVYVIGNQHMGVPKLGGPMLRSLKSGIRLEDRSYYFGSILGAPDFWKLSYLHSYRPSQEDIVVVTKP